jgi:hypothetical protein
MAAFVLRLWLPDRPGALGAVASRVGAVGGDVVGIEILERGAGRAVDELVVDLADASLVDLLLTEVEQVDGVRVEQVRALHRSVHDPRLDALETAAMLVGAATPEESLEALCEHARHALGADWSAVVALDSPNVVAVSGEAPTGAWLTAFVAGSQAAARTATGSPDGGLGETSDVIWTPLPSARAAMVLGRSSMEFRARERRQAAALSRIVDTRFRELSVLRSRMTHPAGRVM